MKKKYLHEYTLRELLLEESEPDFTDTEFMTAVKELRTNGLSHEWVWKYYAESQERVTTKELIKDLEACEEVMINIARGEVWVKSLTTIATLGFSWALAKVGAVLPSLPVDTIKAKMDLFMMFPAVIDLKEAIFDDQDPVDLLHVFGLDDDVIKLVSGNDNDLTRSMTERDFEWKDSQGNKHPGVLNKLYQIDRKHDEKMFKTNKRGKVDIFKNFKEAPPEETWTMATFQDLLIDCHTTDESEAMRLKNQEPEHKFIDWSAAAADHNKRKKTSWDKSLGYITAGFRKWWGSWDDTFEAIGRVATGKPIAKLTDEQQKVIADWEAQETKDSLLRGNLKAIQRDRERKGEVFEPEDESEDYV